MTQAYYEDLHGQTSVVADPFYLYRTQVDKTALTPSKTFVTVLEYEDYNADQRIVSHQAGLLEESIENLLMELKNPDMAKQHRALFGVGGKLIGENDHVFYINHSNYKRINESKLEVTIYTMFGRYYTILLQEA